MICIAVFDCYVLFFFFFKQKTAYEMRISDWSSDVCSSDLRRDRPQKQLCARTQGDVRGCDDHRLQDQRLCARHHATAPMNCPIIARPTMSACSAASSSAPIRSPVSETSRSEEHPSELQSLMRISYAVVSLQKKKTPT